MNVIDLTEEHRSLYFVCLEDWSEEIKEAGDHKKNWFEKMRDRGLRVKLALDDSGRIGGMIQYLPIAFSPAEGRDLYFILCIWVHGHKQGRGNFRNQGLGKALLRAAEEDVKSLGAAGMAAWGMALPVFMRAAWFKKQGYRTADKTGIRRLLWKPFSERAEPPRWIDERKRPEKTEGKVAVTAFINGWCPAMNMAFERAKRAAEGYGDKVDFQIINTQEREIFLEWGISDALFIDGKPIRLGPPPSFDRINKKIAKRVRKK